MKAEAVTRTDILALHRAHRETPVEANRAVTLLSGIFAWAEDEGLVLPEGNPCRSIKKHTGRRRERYLSAQELARLGAALAQAERDAIEPAASGRPGRRGEAGVLLGGEPKGDEVGPRHGIRAEGENALPEREVDGGGLSRSRA